MLGRLLILFIGLIIMCQASIANGLGSTARESQINITMRMIGHEVLLADGDSTSIVLPIEQADNQYIIRFESAFGFDPGVISLKIDSIMNAILIGEDYIVEFVLCDSDAIVYSYEIADGIDMQPCKGRVYSPACYFIKITLLDRKVNYAKSFMPAKADDANASKLGKVMNALLIILVVTFLLILSVFLFRRKKVDEINPDVVQVGDFKFNKKTMMLTSENLRIELTGKETDLLQLLLSSVNNTVERADILKSVWGDEGDYVGRTLDVFISKLRKKLEADSNLRIINIRGIGYKLVLNSEQIS